MASVSDIPPILKAQSSMNNSDSDSDNPPHRQNLPRGAKGTHHMPETKSCRGCGAKVKHIKKHLVTKTECKPFYKEEELNAESLEKRRISRKTYNIAHQDEIRGKKAESYKAKKSQQPGSFNSAAPSEIKQQAL